MRHFLLFVAGSLLALELATGCPFNTIAGPSGKCYALILKPYTVGSMLCHNCWFGVNSTDLESWQTSIHSAFENTFIRSHLLLAKRQTDYFWIGAYRSPWDFSGSGKFGWYDNSPMNYTNFAAGYPGDDDTCTLFRVTDGKWVTNDCTDQYKHGSVCEIQSNGHLDVTDSYCTEAFQ